MRELQEKCYGWTAFHVEHLRRSKAKMRAGGALIL